MCKLNFMQHNAPVQAKLCQRSNEDHQPASLAKRQQVNDHQEQSAAVQKVNYADLSTTGTLSLLFGGGKW